MSCIIYFVTHECIATNESAEGAADGTITLLASDPTGTVKYALGADFDYATGGQLSGAFTGLVAGMYTGYARSSATCLAIIEISVFVTSTYAVRYYNQYYSLGPNATRTRWRFEILKRDYVGVQEQIQGKASVTWGTQGSEYPLNPVIPSECRVELLSTEDEKFLELYTADEREFQVIVYKFGGLEFIQWWKGYVLTGQYSAPYDQLENYTVTVLAADMVENLKDIPFGNLAGSFPQGRMSIMDGIVMIMQHTGLELDFLEGVQFVVTGVSDGFDDTSAINTVEFDPAVYNQGDEPESCYAVLSSLLLSVGARIFQSVYGLAAPRWIIEQVSLKTGGEYNMRAFDPAGASVGAVVANPRLLVRRSLSVSPRLCYMDRSQQMKISQTYGTVNIVYNYTLDPQNNMLINGGFEAVDIEDGQFEGWSVSTPDPTPELASVTDGSGTRTVLKIPFDATQANWAANILANTRPITGNSEAYQIRISFDIFASPVAQGHYLYFDLSAMIEGGSPDDYAMIMPFASATDGSNGLVDSSDFSTYLLDSQVSTDYEFLRFYIDEVNTWKSMSFFFNVDPAAIGSELDGDFQLKFHISGNPVFDYADTTALKAAVTTGTPIRTYNNRRRIPLGSDSAYLYRLEPGSDAESLPNIVRPNDYNASIPFVWKLQGTINVDSSLEGVASYFLLDNVVCQYLPLGGQPDSDETQVAIINENTKFDLDVAVRHADLPSDTNYQNVTKGWLSFSDGSPTETWKLRPADGSTEAKPLIEQLSDMYRGQYSVQRWKETGTFDTQHFAPSFFNTFWEVRNGKVFIPTFMSVDTKNASADVELIETLQGDPVTDNTNLVIDPDSGGPEPPDPAAGRIHSDIFSEIFN